MFWKSCIIDILRVGNSSYHSEKVRIVTYCNALWVESEKREAIICKSAVQSCSTHSKVAAHWLRRGGQREKTRQLKITSNDIIPGNGRILKVYMNIVWLYLSKKLYYVHELFFLFPSDVLSAFLMAIKYEFCKQQQIKTWFDTQTHVGDKTTSNSQN